MAFEFLQAFARFFVDRSESGKGLRSLVRLHAHEPLEKAATS